MATGLTKLDGKWIISIPRAFLQTGWQQMNGYHRYFNSEGVMQTGLKKIGNYWYYLVPSNCIRYSGWQQFGSNWRYFNSDGTMAIGLIKIDGLWVFPE